MKGRSQWTRSAIVREVVKWAEAHDGQAPTQYDWKGRGAPVSAGTIRRHFDGGLLEAIREAGLTPRGELRRAKAQQRREEAKQQREQPSQQPEQPGEVKRKHEAGWQRERRQERREDFERALASGSLLIRMATDEERAQWAREREERRPACRPLDELPPGVVEVSPAAEEELDPAPEIEAAPLDELEELVA